MPAPSESTPRFPNRNQHVVLYPFVSGPSLDLNLESLNHPSRLVNARNEELRLTEDEEGVVVVVESGIWYRTAQGIEAMSLARPHHGRNSEAEDERWDFYWFSLRYPTQIAVSTFKSHALLSNPLSSPTLFLRPHPQSRYWAS